MTIFAFIAGHWSVGEESPVSALRGKYFESLSTDEKVAFYEYDFSVEYLPTNNEAVINNIFDRLNRNTAKLSAQAVATPNSTVSSSVQRSPLLSGWIANSIASFLG